MSSAFVLLNVEVGREEEILRSLCEMNEVDSASLVFGVHDIVIKITTETMEGLEGFIMRRVRAIPGVRSSLTLIVSKDCKNRPSPIEY